MPIAGGQERVTHAMIMATNDEASVKVPLETYPMNNVDCDGDKLRQYMPLREDATKSLETVWIGQ